MSHNSQAYREKPYLREEKIATMVTITTENNDSNAVSDISSTATPALGTS